jgi:transcriptional regulator of heat shock response
MENGFWTPEQIIEACAREADRLRESVVLESEDNYVRSCIAMTLFFSKQHLTWQTLSRTVNVSGSKNHSEISTLIRNDEKIVRDFRQNFQKEYDQFVLSYQQRQEAKNRAKVTQEEEILQLRRDLEDKTRQLENVRRELEEIQRLNSQIENLSIRIRGSVENGLQQNPGNQQAAEQINEQVQGQGNQQAVGQANEHIQGQGNQQAAGQVNEQAQGQGGQDDFEAF